MRVEVEPFGAVIEVGDGQTILECALDAGIDYPFACQQGQCGSCKSILISGQVEMGRLYNPLVCTDEERARGAILACQSRPLSDCVVSVVEIGGRIAHPVRQLDCEVVGVEAHPGGLCVVRLGVERGGPMNFAAGQSAQLHPPAGGAVRGWMSSLPDDDGLEFHLATGAWHTGMRVRVEGPHGEAYLHDEHLGPMIGVAEAEGAGTLLSVFGQALKSGMRQPMQLIVAATDASGVYCADRLALLAQASRNVGIHVTPFGEALAQAVAGRVADARSARAHVAATQATCDAVRAVLVERGVDTAMIVEHPLAKGL